jgi:hypothetical protein
MSSMDFANASGMDRSGEKPSWPALVECLSSVFALGSRQFFGESQRDSSLAGCRASGTLDHAAKFNDLGAARCAAA